ncbi:MAG: cytochrome-c peroxidase [Flavobacteriia bacterium]|nr:cytochrome-c peroxidase [Flavobacteriia bacterium]
MKNIWLLLLAFFLFLAAAISPVDGLFYVPENWPKPTYNFEDNPVSLEGFNLGRALFYDPILSKDSTISCASCHLQYTAFAHVDHPTSHGVESRVGKRNAPGLMNLAWNPYFHWDGGALTLNGQAVNPITHPDEMGSSLQMVLKKLNANPNYKSAFKEVFNTSEIKTHHLLKALAQFTASLVSSNSKFDQVMRKETTFTTQEQKGYVLFKKYCVDCHKAPLFTNYSFEANGIGPNPALLDSGRSTISGKSKDAFLFRVPTLRNVEYSFPYMHDGRFAKLKDVIHHYAAPENWKNPISEKLIRKKISLSFNEEKDLLAFLKTLTDKGFLFHSAYSYSAIK